MIISKYLNVSIIMIAGVIGVELYGLPFIVSMFFGYSFITILDTVFGFYLARRGKIVSSKTLGDGFFIKMMWLFMLAGSIFFLGNMAHTIGNDKITELASLVVITILVIAIGKELISLLENVAVLSNERESKALHFVIGLMLKIAGIGKEQLQRKVEKYLPPK